MLDVMPLRIPLEMDSRCYSRFRKQSAASMLGVILSASFQICTRLIFEDGSGLGGVFTFLQDQHTLLQHLHLDREDLVRGREMRCTVEAFRPDMHRGNDLLDHVEGIVELEPRSRIGVLPTSLLYEILSDSASSSRLTPCTGSSRRCPSRLTLTFVIPKDLNAVRGAVAFNGTITPIL